MNYLEKNHDYRNSLERAYREHLYIGIRSVSQDLGKTMKDNRLAKWQFPYMSLQNDNLQLHFAKHDKIYGTLPLREYSALINLIENIYNQKTSDPIRAKKVTLKIIEKINDICEENDIKFIIVEMSQKSDAEVAALCQEKGIHLIDASLNIDREGYRNLPYDHHPSPRAHGEYFNAMLPAFEEMLDVRY